MQSKMKWKTEAAANPLETNKMLRESALGAFSVKAFGEASLNEIIKGASVNKGSFYYRFYDKLDLYLSLIAFIGEEKIRFISSLDFEKGNQDLFGLLRAQVHAGLAFAMQYPQYNAMWKKVLSEEKSTRAIIEEELGETTSSKIFDLISQATRKGGIREDLPPRLVANVVQSIFNGLDMTLSPDCDEQETAMLADAAISIIKDGIAVG